MWRTTATLVFVVVVVAVTMFAETGEVHGADGAETLFEKARPTRRVGAGCRLSRWPWRVTLTSMSALALALAGGEKRLKRRPSFSCLFSPTSDVGGKKKKGVDDQRLEKGSR